MKAKLTKEEKILEKERRKEEAKLEKQKQKEREEHYKNVVAYEKEHKKEEKIAPTDSFISLQHLNKIYSNHVQAVYDFNLEIKEKEFIVFVGPSGCGKSTTLRMIAGLEDITSGDLYIDGMYANDKEPKDRDVAMVFQSYALYPHMTVYDNLAFGLEVRHVPKAEIQQRIQKASKILQIEEYLDRKPKALSGGQCQRVALGRAIVRNAKVFLMDEPLSNLDAKLRVQMRSEIVNLHNELGATTIYVTHDQTEAMTMATRIVVMKKGYIQQIGTPKEIYNHPSNVFVATFIGSPAMNIMKVTYSKGFLLFAEGFKLELPTKIIKAHDTYYRKKYNALKKLENKTDKQVELMEQYHKCLINDHDVLFGIRPENIVRGNEANYLKNKSDIANAQIKVAELLGNEYYLHLIFEGKEIIAKVHADKDANNKQAIKIAFDMNKLHLFDAYDEDGNIIY